jgi:hypothetical protein
VILFYFLAQQAPNPASSLMLVGGVIAMVRQKQAIGGWLFYFLWVELADRHPYRHCGDWRPGDPYL